MIEVRIVDTPDEATTAALAELDLVLARTPRPLVSFATGATFAGLYARLAARGPLPPQLLATHLDEYLGFRPGDRGGMVHEIVTSCPPLGEMLRRGTFLPVPSSGEPQELAAHARKLAAAGGIELQFLGIGRNGHLAFNEPGTARDLGFHRTLLAGTTRTDARARFAPAQVPREAVTAGLATILGARRIVLLATGTSKRAAVQAMLAGGIGPQTPASYLREHEHTLVVLDRAAAGP